MTYSMVTRDAIGEAATANNRMPLIVPAAMREDWLDPDQAGDERFRHAVVAASEPLSFAGRIIDPVGQSPFKNRCSDGTSEPHHSATYAVIMMDTRTFGRSTPSLVTARAGGAVGNTVAYDSFIPAKSSGFVRSTVTCATS